MTIMKEKWNAYMTDIIQPNDYELKELIQNRNGAKLSFSSDKGEVVFEFFEGLISIRSCDESDRWKTIDSVLRERGPEFLKSGLMYRVENSEYKRWFIEETYSTWTDDELEHYVFVTANDVVDVLALGAPTVKSNIYD